MTEYKINKGFVVQKLDQKTVIFDGEKSVLYTLNETASFMFQKLKLGWGREKIINVLMKKYEIKEKRAQRDFDELINNLLAKKIITQKKE